MYLVIHTSCIDKMIIYNLVLLPTTGPVSMQRPVSYRPPSMSVRPPTSTNYGVYTPPPPGIAECPPCEGYECEIMDCVNCDINEGGQEDDLAPQRLPIIIVSAFLMAFSVISFGLGKSFFSCRVLSFLGIFFVVRLIFVDDSDDFDLIRWLRICRQQQHRQQQHMVWCHCQCIWCLVVRSSLLHCRCDWCGHVGQKLRHCDRCVGCLWCRCQSGRCCGGWFDGSNLLVTNGHLRRS